MVYGFFGNDFDVIGDNQRGMIIERIKIAVEKEDCRSFCFYGEGVFADFCYDTIATFKKRYEDIETIAVTFKGKPYKNKKYDVYLYGGETEWDVDRKVRGRALMRICDAVCFLSGNDFAADLAADFDKRVLIF